MPDPVEIREVGAAEQDLVTELWSQGGLTRPWNDPATDFARAHQGPASTVLGAYREGALVGTVMVGHEGHRGWIYYLAVSAEHRGQRVGRSLVEAAERWLVARDIPKLMLMIRRENDAVARFYRDAGYQEQDVMVLGRFLTD